MTPEQLEFSSNLQKLHPEKAQKISKMLRFVSGVENDNVWEQFSSELKDALAANDDKRIYLLEGLMRRMQGMLSDGAVVAKPKKKYWWLIALALGLLFLIYLGWA